MENNYSDRIHGIASLIGDTPLLAIDLVFNGKKGTVYAKAEYLSMRPEALRTEWPTASCNKLSGGEI